MSDLESSSHEECPPEVFDPFAPPPAMKLNEDGLVLAEAVEAPPLLWPTFVVVLIAIGGAMVVSGLAIGVAAVVDRGAEVFQGGLRFNDWLQDFISTEAGLALMVVPGQLTFCGVALVAAAFSRQRPADRLGLRQGSFPWWTWPLFLLGTPVIGMVMVQVLSRVVPEPSEQLKLLENLFSAHAARSPVLLLLLISVLPGIVEELLFRGFLQRRLLARLPVVTSIGITTVFFAAAHMDPMHAIGVLPLGIWLGIVAWRADSIWPAVFGHVGNNGFAIAMSALTGAEPDEVGPLAMAAMSLMLLGFAGCIVVLTTRRARPA